MPIHTQQSISGFIATEPRLTYTASGVARFYARFGQEHYRREADDSFTKLEPTFSNLVMYNASAERAYDRFTKGDSFVAEGKINTYDYERDGQQIAGEEFVARKIGHDTARTRYDVDRTPRQVTEHDAAARTAADREANTFESPTRSDQPGPSALSV
ncbi:single-stranded DNA-binding protein [Microlunatus speluncae]|uniref:single-stranded DNA-binding protein n=1 Tax=Microlunatus speluncae TaxID=2594267 RepID=UPI0012666699|nr:single-stranded DNA-binding protein [Microlunatus speluncae]